MSTTKRKVNYEQRVLHALMTSTNPTSLISKVLEYITPENFMGSEKDLFQTIINRWNAGASISLPDMIDLYPGNFVIDEIISSTQRIYAPESVIEFSKEIKKRSQLRLLKELGQTLLDTTKTVSTNVDDVLSITEDYVLRVQQSTSEKSRNLSSIVDSMEQRVLETKGKHLLGSTTTFAVLDSLTKGLIPNSYWVVGGETNIGKSLFTQHLVKGALDSQVPVLIVSLELSGEEVGFRLLSSFAGVPLSTLFYDGIAQHKKAFDGMLSLLQINDACLTLSDVVFAIKLAVRQFGAKLIIVDYIQNIVVPKSTGEYQALNEATRTLQRMAQIENCCIVAVSQLGRNSKEDLFSFKGSGNLENSADIAVVLTKDVEASETLGKEILSVRIIKNRLFGFKGEMKAVKDITRGVLHELTESPF